ncbi:MAG: HlyD family secretion protein [Planctomycetaceae bacterium]
MKWISILGVTATVGVSVLLWQQGFLPLPQAQSRGAERTRIPPDSRGEKIFASGYVEGRRRETRLNFEIAGRLVAIHVREGSRVKKGDILAHLDDAMLRHRLAEAKARLLQARAERKRLVNGASPETRRRVRAELAAVTVRVKHAKTDLVRALAAYKRGAITDQSYDDYRYRHDTAQAEWNESSARVAETEAKVRADDLAVADAKVGLAEVEVDRVRTLLQKTVLRAPDSGIVSKIDVEPGEWVGVVEAGRTQPVLVFVDDSIIHVRAYVEELEVLSLRIGQRAVVKVDSLPAKSFPGTVTQIAPSVHHKRHRHHNPGERIDVSVREVLIQIMDPGELVIGLPVEVFIERDIPQDDPES